MKAGVVILLALGLYVEKRINHLTQQYFGSVMCLVCFDIQFVINELVDFSAEN
jgi:hypothetical protein